MTSIRCFPDEVTFNRHRVLSFTFAHHLFIRNDLFMRNVLKKRKKKCVQEANVRKSCKVLYRSDQGKYF